jgi:hypothetical protein
VLDRDASIAVHDARRISVEQAARFADRIVLSA